MMMKIVVDRKNAIYRKCCGITTGAAVFHDL
jgi:hypothetical protein